MPFGTAPKSSTLYGNAGGGQAAAARPVTLRIIAATMMVVFIFEPSSLVTVTVDSLHAGEAVIDFACHASHHVRHSRHLQDRRRRCRKVPLPAEARGGR